MKVWFLSLATYGCCHSCFFYIIPFWTYIYTKGIKIKVEKENLITLRRYITYRLSKTIFTCFPQYFNCGNNTLYTPPPPTYCWCWLWPGASHSREQNYIYLCSTIFQLWKQIVPLPLSLRIVDAGYGLEPVILENKTSSKYDIPSIWWISLLLSYQNKTKCYC